MGKGIVPIPWWHLPLSEVGAGYLEESAPRALDEPMLPLIASRCTHDPALIDGEVVVDISAREVLVEVGADVSWEAAGIDPEFLKGLDYVGNRGQSEAINPDVAGRTADKDEYRVEVSEADTVPIPDVHVDSVEEFYPCVDRAATGMMGDCEVWPSDGGGIPPIVGLPLPKV